MEKQIKLFEIYRNRKKKLSSNTLQSYNRDLQQFREYLSDVEVRYTHVHEEHIKKYISRIKKNGKKIINDIKKHSINKIIFPIFS